MRKIKKVLVAVLAVYLAIAMIITVRVRLKSALQTFAETKGNAELTLALQNELYQHLREKKGEYLTVHYDATDRISAISIHSDSVTLLASEMTVLLLDLLKRYENQSFGIPLGNLTDFVLLSGKGPEIPLRPVATGNIASEMCSTLQSAGINQTLHKVSIRFVVAIRYLAPIENYADTITFDIVVAETLVVGDVPIYRD